MSRFGHVLQRLDAELVSPEPVRTRVLLEIAQDLEGAYQAYLDNGLSDADALRKSAAVLGLNAETARELSRLHTPPGASWLLRRVRGQSRDERIALTAVTIAALAGSGWTLAGSALFRTGGHGVWLLLALAGLIVWNATAIGLGAFGGRGPSGSTEARLELLPVLAGIAAITGALSGAISIVRSASATDAALRLSDVIGEVASAAEVVTLALSIALVALLLWFHLDRRVADLRLLRAELDQFIHQEEAT